jgi:23S rRNA (uracil1939-C5)-methyltransferase
MPIDYAEQRQRKINALRQSLGSILSQALPEIHFIEIGESSMRDRADLVVFAGGYGLYQKSPKQLFSVEECPQLSPDLFRFYLDLKKEKILLKNPKGSIRLRISPDGKRGLWLDFSNEDVQFLFEEKSTLQRLLNLAFVEIGQKRKKLVWDKDRFRLQEPEFHTWTRTWVGDSAIPLYSVVGGFSQSSDKANQTITQKISELAKTSSAKNWIEFGCGNGNLTFPLAHQSDSVLALEYEGLALAGLEKSLEANPLYKNKIEFRSGNFQKAAPDLFQKKLFDGILVNPPRSGLKDFLNPLAEISLAKRPRDFIYMSCFLDTFTQDSAKLSQLGYLLKELCIIDQFPQSEHFEILSRWRI